MVLAWGSAAQGVLAVALGLLLVGAVLAAVHHAEVVAARVGEPLGSVILALAVTVIEVGVIVMSMLGPKAQPTLVRDTVFAALMICTNGIVGLSLLINAGRRGQARFRTNASSSMLAAVTAVATLTMVLPNFTSHPGPVFTGPQLAFAAVASLATYLLFIVTQTNTHRDFFQPVDSDGNLVDAADHHATPTNRETAISAVLLLMALVAVVGLAKIETPAIEGALASVGLPASFVGIIIAMVVLAPETLAAARSSQRDHVQTSLNLGYGSAMASIALTIPTMAVLTLVLPLELHLGLGPLHMALLALTVVVSILTVLPGRAGRLEASLHLVILGAYLFLAAMP